MLDENNYGQLINPIFGFLLLRGWIYGSRPRTMGHRARLDEPDNMLILSARSSLLRDILIFSLIDFQCGLA
jgi:hypothetical protein